MGVGSDAGADERDGTLKRRTTKRTLLNEPAPPPVPIMGRKKGHGNSGPEQPGKTQTWGLWGVRLTSAAFLLSLFLKTSTAFHYFGKNKTKQKNTQKFSQKGVI